MYVPNPYFANIPQLGNLALDYIFVEDGYPILFTCKNENKIYLCLCRSLSPEQKWVISETNIDILRKMTNREISICEAFKRFNTKSCIALWSKANPVERYSVFSTCELQKTDLPDDMLFLDEDDVEDALDYVKALEREAVLQATLEIDSKISGETDSIYAAQYEVKTHINYGVFASGYVFERTTAKESIQVTTCYAGHSFENVSCLNQSVTPGKETVHNDLKTDMSIAA